MSNSKNSDFGFDFIEAQLYTGPTETFVHYSATDPKTGKLKRKKIKLNRYKTVAERKRRAKILIKEINRKLYEGWNPWLEDSAPKGFEKLQTALATFLSRKKRELKANSMRSYYSYVGMFNEWLDIEGKSEIKCNTFNKALASDFLNHAYDSKNLSNNTFNNYRGFFVLLWNWLQSENYVESNVFESIQKRKGEAKKREIIPEPIRKRIKAYFRFRNPDMYIVSLLVYHTLIRPGEICFLKPENFELDTQIIIVPEEAAKNGKSRVSTIPDVIMKDLVKYRFGGASYNDFIFGKGFEAGRVKMDPRRLSKVWDKMRRDLDLPQKYQLYSLRDTGIVQLLRDGVSPDEVMKQAGHHSLEITTQYIRHYVNDGSEAIKRKATGF